MNDGLSGKETMFDISSAAAVDGWMAVLVQSFQDFAAAAKFSYTHVPMSDVVLFSSDEWYLENFQFSTSAIII